MCHNLVPVRSQLGRLCAILILTMSHCSNWLTQLIAPSHNSCPRRFATFQLNLFVFTINLCCTASRRVGWYVAGMPCQYIKLEIWMRKLATVKMIREYIFCQLFTFNVYSSSLLAQSKSLWEKFSMLVRLFLDFLHFLQSRFVDGINENWNSSSTLVCYSEREKSQPTRKWVSKHKTHKLSEIRIKLKMHFREFLGHFGKQQKYI